jgi:hypothetical protein
MIIKKLIVNPAIPKKKNKIAVYLYSCRTLTTLNRTSNGYMERAMTDYLSAILPPTNSICAVSLMLVTAARR